MRFLQNAFALAVATVAAGCNCAVSRHGDDHAAPEDAGSTDAAAVIDASTDSDAGPPAHIPAECWEAANRGIGWLVNQQNVDGSWGTVYTTASTAFAVLKLQTYAAEIGMSPFDPAFAYAEHVASGLDHLFLQARRTPIHPQPYGHPDANGNGEGIHFSALDTDERMFAMYQNAIVLMAITAGAEPARVVTAGASQVSGLTFRRVVEDVVDYLAMSQSDAPETQSGCSRGGWNYTPIDRGAGGVSPDNSVTQFVTLALEYARHPLYGYEISTQGWVLGELRKWVNCIQNRDGTDADGGSGYRRPNESVDVYKTGALVQQLAFLGDGAASGNVVAALDYLRRMWTSNLHGWHPDGFSDKLAMYSVMKGMESVAITDLGGIDWYREFCDNLIAEQLPDGSWPMNGHDFEVVNPGAPVPSGLLSTIWALLVLERAAPPPPVID